MPCLGSIVQELLPGADNPRNSEGSFITLSDGSIQFFYSRFTGEQGRDDSPSDIARITSKDGGQTWSSPEIIRTAAEYGAINIMSVSLLPMADADIGLFYCIRAGANDCRLHLQRSSDEGLTWTEPICCIEPPGYNVVNNDRVVRLSNGRLIAPAAFHRNGYDTQKKNKKILWDSRAVDVFFLSDDDGFNWIEGQGKCALPFSGHSNSGLQEPGLLELKNGVLWAWARTDIGNQYEVFSFDQGESWTAAQPSRFTSPCSPLSIKRLPDGDNIVAVWNPIPNYNGRIQNFNGAWMGGRTPLVAAVSTDEGKTWSELHTIDDDPERGYCYTAIHFAGDSMFLAYCAGGVEDGGCLNRLRIKKIPLSQL